MADRITQHWSPSEYAANARFVSDLGKSVLDLLAPRPSEQILDLGCGDGALTRVLAERAGGVTGIDASPEMIAAAQKLNLNVSVADGTKLGFHEEFDAVFSNAALHWMQPADAVVDSVWRALRPGGRFVAEFGGEGNVATIRDALNQALLSRGLTVTNPWYFPSAEAYGDLLRARGFEVIDIELFPRLTPQPGHIRAWLETFAQHYTAQVPETDRPALLDDAVDLCKPKLCDASGNWDVDYVRLRFHAQKGV